MRKILLIGNYRYDGQRSMQKFARMLAAGLAGPDTEVRLIRPEPLFGALAPGSRSIRKWLGYIDKFLIFPMRLALVLNGRWRPDVLHICDQANAMYAHAAWGVPVVVTVHDLLAVRSAFGRVAENPVGWTGRLLMAWVRSGLARAQSLVCDSTNTRDELLDICNVPASRTSVVLNAIDDGFAPVDDAIARSAVRRLVAKQKPEWLTGKGTAPFILHVGNNNWYKNRRGVLRIFREVQRLQPDLKLIMAGAAPTDDLTNLVQDSGCGESVLFAVGPTDAEVIALYQQAELLLFPSIAEGFGWPIVEAQLLGCPVVTTNRAPMTEVSGDAAVYIDPADETASAHAVKNVVKMPLADRIEIVELGIENAKRFSAVHWIAGYRSAHDTVLPWAINQREAMDVSELPAMAETLSNREITSKSANQTNLPAPSAHCNYKQRSTTAV